MTLLKCLSSIAFSLLVALALSACGSGPRAPLLGGPDLAAAGAEGGIAAYRLGAGDRIRVIVFGEESLSGEFEVDSTGSVSLPLIGEVLAAGEVIRDFEARVRERLAEGYLRDPRVSVEVLNYRPFYIIGEVNKGGEYPYTAGMTILNAIAVAGGYTYRADTRLVIVTRGGREFEAPAVETTTVMPGDVIRVPERIF